MQPKKVNIIGGGMAGLCAGSYLQMNGYDVTIFEMNSTPGGVCTSWKRGNYTVDLCIHWLVGSGPESSFYERWSELIDLGEIKFVNHDEFFRVEDEEGNHISVFSDIDRLEKEFLQKAPEDETEIHQFIHALRKLTTFDISTEKAQELANVWDRFKSFAKLIPHLGTFGKYKNLTCKDYSEHFKNPLLKKVILNLTGAEMGLLFGMITLTWFHNKTAGYPVGGSLVFAKKIFENYQQLGGKINFNSHVSKILVNNNTAAGIELSDGKQYFADYIISAADGHATIFEMLEGKYTDEKLLGFYRTAKTFPSLVFVSLGIKKDLHVLPHMLLIPLPEPLVLDPETSLNDILMHNHSYDSTLAPAGSTLVTFLLATYNYEYWNKLYRDNKDVYEKEKSRISCELINVLEKRFGDIIQNIEMSDVSTPVSFCHFSGNWEGSFEGWLMTPEVGLKHLSHTLKGLKNFYMCGQWVAIGGGLPGVLVSGRDTAQLICHEDGKNFEVNKVLSTTTRQYANSLK
jgi:phytoene dehydrogenase-like protein